MTYDEKLSLPQMQAERRSSRAVYLEFMNNRKYYNQFAFCFYEGEDGKYFDCRIRQYFENKFVTHLVGNKKEVLKLLKKIKEAGLYDDVCTMFFVDRDYDESLANIDEDLYETPCYSIENLYVQEECFLKILQSEFGLNRIDSDCQKCLRDFKMREKEFNNYILEFNALVYLRRKRSDSNSDCSFSSYKTSHMVQIRVNEILKAARYDETINSIKEKLDIEDYEIDDAKKELTMKGDFSLNFRGKNQLDFFVEFINGLKSLNSTGGYFSTKYNNIHINITSNRLSELSQYAVFPTSLKKFLERHKIKFQEIISAG